MYESDYLSQGLPLGSNTVNQLWFSAVQLAYDFCNLLYHRTNTLQTSEKRTPLNSKQLTLRLTNPPYVHPVYTNQAVGPAKDTWMQHMPFIYLLIHNEIAVCVQARNS